MNKKIFLRKLDCIWWGIFGSGHIHVFSRIDRLMIGENKICLSVWKLMMVLFTMGPD